MSVGVFLIEFLILAQLKASGIDPIDNLTVCFFILAFIVAFVIDVSKSAGLRYCKGQLMAGLLFRVALLFFDRYGKSIFTLPNSGADSETFYFNAKWRALGQPSRRSESFISLFQWVFETIGTNRLFGQFIIVLFSIVALCATAWTLNELRVPAKNKRFAMTVIVLLPNFAVLSSVFLRESIVTMFASLSMLFFVRYMNRKSLVNLAVSVVSLLLGMVYHSGVAGMGVGYIIVIFLYDRRSQRNNLTIGRVILAALLSIAMLYAYTNYGDVLFKKLAGIDDVSDVANLSSYGRTNYGRYVGNSNSIRNMIIYTLPRMIYFLFSPFPWQWGTIPDLFGFFFSGMYYFLVLLQVVRFLRREKGGNRTLVLNLLIITLSLVFVFAWGTVNSGTACRHREKSATLFALLLALTWNPNKKTPYLAWR